MYILSAQVTRLVSVILIIYWPGLVSAEILPGLPESLAKPYEEVNENKIFNSSTELEGYLKARGYTLESIYQDEELPPIYVTNVPEDLKKLRVHQKTSLFIRLFLPSVVKVNRDILALREELERLIEKVIIGIQLTAKEQQWLASVASHYSGDVDNLMDLLDRVDVLPVSLIMAQAIEESGWGTSHFAIKGNAFFGQHLSNESTGTYMTTPNGQVRVAAFENIYHSIASYIHNLNTTKTYQCLRDERAEIRSNHGKLTGKLLAGSLIYYSECGQLYVDTLRSLFTHYKLEKLDDAVISDNTEPVLVRLKK
jgi:uncharacterized FlgJ-related protein